MKNNRIPRNATKMQVIMKVESTAGKVGEILNAWKDTNGWHGKSENGQTYFLFLSMLRNPNVCEIKITEYEEDFLQFSSKKVKKLLNDKTRQQQLTDFMQSI